MSRLLRRGLCLAALLACTSAGWTAPICAVNSGGIRFDPSAPDSHSFIRITVGAMVNGCMPHGATITRSGSSITVHYPNPVPPNGACVAAIYPWKETLALGTVTAGEYDVVASVDDALCGPHTFASRKLQVLDADAPFRFAPSVVPATGGTPVFLILPDGEPLPDSVVFDGVSVPATPTLYRSFDRQVAIVIPPAHAPGSVDAVVNFGPYGSPLNAHAALEYSDPAAPVDSFAFEPVLFPIAFEGPGAFGSRWTTENVVEAADWPAIFRAPLPCAGCTSIIEELNPSGRRALVPDNDPAGLLLWLARLPGRSLFANSRVRDTSRQALAAGTEVPVVREADFRFESVKLLNVPFDGHSRANLRVWALGNPAGSVFVWAYTNTRSDLAGSFSSLPMQQTSADGPWFGNVDVTAALKQLRSGETATFRITPGGADPDVRIWAMLSLTNNYTQQVTIVSPH